MLLSKAKRGKAADAIEPFIRWFDDGFELDDIHTSQVIREIEDKDGYVPDGHSWLEEIGCFSEELIAQGLKEHYYPDGCVLFLGRWATS